ncbi:MAG: Gldg family protein [Hyphomicrobium sp.]|nr:Gldg family protein [Hyphomicrobium sp.]
MTDESTTEDAKSPANASSDRYVAPYERFTDWVSSLDRKTMAWTGLALGAVILLSVNLIAGIGLKNWKADLTEDRLFTISDGTRLVLRAIDEPITARLYFSRRLAESAPEMSRYFDRVRALLEQYRDISGGKFELAVLDPEPFSDAEDRAVASGLRGVRLNTEGEIGYFGLVANNSVDGRETIPFFAADREAFLEYDVTKLIATLANPKKRVVGIMTGLPLDGGEIDTPMGKRPEKSWLIMDQIREFFDVRTIPETATTIPADIDVLMIAQPKGLTEAGAYAIDQYALKGGKVVVFIDPLPESAQLAMLQNQGEGRRHLSKVLEGWGVKFDGTEVAADIRNARRVQFGGRDGNMVTEFVAWLALGKEAINSKDVLAAGIDVLNLASAGHLVKADGAKIDMQPILETSADAAIVPASKMGFGADPVSLLREYIPGRKKLVLAARLGGDAPSAFPNGKPGEAAKPDAGKSANPAKEHVASGRLNAIVVADTDILADQFWVDRREMMGQEMVVPAAHNAAFVVGALENLSGSDALIALRGRGVNERPFTWVDELRRSAERRFREKEQQLEARLKSAEDELRKLETAGEDGDVVMTEKEQKAIEAFRADMLATRRELREVKRELRRDIDKLDGWLKFANIALVPLLVIGAGLFWSARGRKKDQ